MKRNRIPLLLFLLAVASPPQAQTLDYNQRTFIFENAHNIHPDSTFSRSSWEYLVPNINNKRIILPGEFNHGAKEALLVRNDLIRFLHETLGFNTIVFESGIGETAATDINRKQLTAAQMMPVFPGGRPAKEDRELMDYIKKRNISVAGYDIQRTGNSFSGIFKCAARKLNLDTAFCGKLESRYAAIERELADKNAVYDTVSAKTLQLVADYQKIREQLSINKAGNFSREHLFTLKTITNRIRFLQYMLRFVKDHDGNGMNAARDSAMADNIRWLADSIFNNEKLIVLGHNFHIARYNAYQKVMGELLHEYFPNDVYSLGIFAGSGSYADSTGKETKMLPPDPAATDLKHIIARTRGFTSFLHIPEKPITGTEWLHQPITVNDTYTNPAGSGKMIMAKQFDGLLLLKKVSPPER